ncbi:MAG: hypothetical protein HWE30_18210 [Methylocystaceae bacterium]|uniref:hypothetical protein n=1 Tax=Salipiger sp. HF18 TaxID=2721557 RepID=UPI00142D9FDF|nr:hypothetical protein [Salipiger sp. HF18]NIY98389.1 hypothetical protein [Salipiger sp. HF18]NVK20629.1 hypothetical protein [Methylocystaceae bacterium]
MSILLRAHMFGELVKAVGGVDAAAAAIEAVVGHTVSRGTISKVQNGHSEVPYAWVTALENATGRHPFLNMRSREVSGRPAKSELACHLDMLREATEGITALAEFEANPDDPQTMVKAYAELADVHDMAGATMTKLKGLMGIQDEDAA